MKTEYRFAEALKEMMSESPLDSVSVTALCRKCKANRQTFYYHFHDIYDLLTLVFLNEEIPEAANTKTVRDLMVSIFDYYTKNKAFIDATLNSAAKELFEEFIQNICYKSLLRFVNAAKESKKLSLNDRKAIARFYALAYSRSAVYYLSTYKAKSLEGLLNCFAFASNTELEDAVNRLLIVRSKQQ